MPYSMRKIRGKDLYKVFNTETGEIKSHGSTKKDAKAQLRLLRGLEKKEAGSLKADQIKEVIDNSYNNKKEGAPSGYMIDKELSDGRVKVYKDLNSDQVIVAHRGSSGWRDWLDNAYYATTGNIRSSGTYKKHKEKHQKAIDKYGQNNIISVGHSRAGKYVEELNKEKPVKEVITYNKAVGLHDAFQKNPENQTDIRTSKDLVSALTPFQRSANKVVTIPEKSWNLLKAHGTSALSSLGNKLIGRGFKQMRVGDMRKFIKAFKKAKYGEKWIGGAKFNKKQLTEMIKPMLEDDDIDEMVGGSVWTDFVKEFSSKHGLKYACALSKYKEPLKKAYKLKKENKEWYEPLKETSEIGVGSEKPEEKKDNITFKIEEKEPEPKPEPKPDEKVGRFPTSLLEELDNEATFPILVYQTKSLSGLTDVVEKLIKKGVKIVPGLLFTGKNNITAFLNSLFTYWTKKIGVMEGIKKIDAGIRSFIEYLGGGELLPEQTDYNEYLKTLNTTNKKILYEAMKKQVIGSGVLSGGNKWTDFVKDYAKSYNTTYGCALSDLGIKNAYRLFKDGKEWFLPKAKEIETQTDEFVEPEPEPAPDNIEPVVNRIEEKIKALEAEGAAKGAVSYNPATIVVDVAFVNMIKKYGGKCILNRVDRDFFIDNSLTINTQKSKTLTLNYPERLKKLGEQLKECVDRGVRVIVIPLSIHFGSSMSGHENLLIYRPFKRLAERYEPHGAKYGNSDADDKSINSQLRELFEVKLTPYLGPIRYREPWEICPMITSGLQSLEGSLRGLEYEGGGFCAMWALFVAEMIFVNPDKSTKEIIEEVYRITNSEPVYLKSVIRGYVREVEKELDVLLKTLKSPGFQFVAGKKPKRDAYNILMESHDKLYDWVLNTIFDTKKYSEAPPDFEPLPDVTIREVDDEEKLKNVYKDKLKPLKIAELKNIFNIYGLIPNEKKKDDIIDEIVRKLNSGKWAKYGGTGLKDIDRILEEGLHKTEKKDEYKIIGIARQGYFKIDESGAGVMSAGKVNIGKAFKNMGRSFEKAGQTLAKGTEYVNPMMWALKDKGTRDAMIKSGEVTNDYLLPAVVSAGKPVYDTAAMTGSTLLTGNPLLGKVAADELWKNMVEKPGYDPRERQQSAILGDVSSKLGNVAAKEYGAKMK